MGVGVGVEWRGANWDTKNSRQSLKDSSLFIVIGQCESKGYGAAA